jgi:DNA-binding FadR family transcriptional regulator
VGPVHILSTLAAAGGLPKALGERNRAHDVIRSAICTRDVELARVATQSHITETLRLFGTRLGDTA